MDTRHSSTRESTDSRPHLLRVTRGRVGSSLLRRNKSKYHEAEAKRSVGQFASNSIDDDGSFAVSIGPDESSTVSIDADAASTAF